MKGAIFDLDGVLLDSMAVWSDLGARYLRSIAVLPEEGLGGILFSMSMEQGAEYLKRRYGLKANADEILSQLRRMLRDFYFHEVPAKPGAGELLRLLRSRGIPMAAATSSPREHVTRALERNGLLEYIDAIYTTSEVGVSKHAPDIYDLAAGAMRLNASEIAVFEDSLYALRTAAKAGYITVGVYDANGEADQDGMREVSDYYLKTLKDFPQTMIL